MLTYERYLIKSIALPFFVSITVLTGLVWISQILRLMFLLENNIIFVEFIITSLMVIPTLLNSVMPFAILYASLLSINNLKSNKELIILQCAGVGIKEIINTVLRLVSLIALAALINASYIMPKTYSRLKNNLFLFKTNISGSVIQDGFFNIISKNLVLFINKKTNKNNFDGIIIFDHRNSQDSVLIAEKGDLQYKNGVMGLNLEKGSKQSFGANNNLEIMQFDKFRVSIQQEKMRHRSLNDYDVQELTMYQLLFPEKNLSKARNTLKHELNSRVSWSIMNILLPIAALCIFLKADFNRKESIMNLLKSLSFAIMFVAIHFLILSLTITYPLLNILLYVNLFFGFIIAYYIISREG